MKLINEIREIWFYQNLPLKILFFILLILFFVILFLPSLLAKPITLNSLNINGTLCTDKPSKVIFQPVDKNKESVSVDNFIYFIRPNETYYKNISTLFHSQNTYVLILNITNSTEEITFYGQASQRGKIVKNNTSLIPKKCLSFEDKAKKDIFDFETYINKNWVYILLFLIFIASLIVIGVVWEQLQKKKY